MGCYDRFGCGDRPNPYTDFYRRRDFHRFGPDFRGPCRDYGRCNKFHPHPHRPFFHDPPKYY